MTFPGRFEVLRDVPPLVIDGAHNPDAAAVLAGAIAEAFGDALPLIVLGILADKDAGGIVRALAPVASGFICTQNESPRALAPDVLAATVAEVTGVKPMTAPDVAAAIAHAAAAAPDRAVVVTGSLYTAGEARRLFGPQD
jgi:dihydrofolate synthase/folylpolyglutamate synthase